MSKGVIIGTIFCLPFLIVMVVAIYCLCKAMLNDLRFTCNHKRKSIMYDRIYCYDCDSFI